MAKVAINLLSASSSLLSCKTCFSCLFVQARDMFERFLLSLKTNLQLLLSVSKVLIFFSTDNHSRVYLKPSAIPGSDYINASFINVRPCYSHWLSRGVERCFVMGGTSNTCCHGKSHMKRGSTISLASQSNYGGLQTQL